ncbi:MAG: mannose-1-phosphate guanylyltransferase [Pseudomonas fluorescens]|nr:MAG: mannose-1-phosphate guanylyltransferase [Pseudomonas fluorescens]
MSEIKTAMVLAAGLGTRLRPLTDNLPKPLINIGGTPVIIRILNMLHEAGIERVVINTHYLAHMLETAVKAATPVGMKVYFSYEETLLETGGGMKKALPLLGDDPYLVVNSDAVWMDEVKPLLKPLMAAFDGEKHDTLLAVVPLSETKAFLPLGDFKFNKKTKALDRVPPREKWDVVVAGVYVMKPGVIMHEVSEKFSVNKCWDDLRAVGRLHGWLYTGRWREIGSHQGLEMARAMVAGV